MLLFFYSSACTVFLPSYFFFTAPGWFGLALHLSCWRLPPLSVGPSVGPAAKNETADWEFPSHRQGSSVMGLTIE